MIKYYNRKTGEYEIEKVVGDKYLSWTYNSDPGKNLLEIFVKRKLFSSIYGSYCNSKLSRSKVKNFIKNFNIDINETIKNEDEFTSFNDFFTRKLKNEVRPIDNNINSFISPADGRITVYENIDIEKLVQIKGFTYSLNELLNNKDTALKYSNGTCIIVRLCPTDYHRFHFVDSGSCCKIKKINGDYYSVNPIALKKIPQLFCRNKRELSTFKSDNFGDILYVEVGATCVGSIIQTYPENDHVRKGSEKGYFKYGGSTVILFIEKDKIKIDDDILKQSLSGFETKVFMGDRIGKRRN